jgi:hypothetical protein
MSRINTGRVILAGLAAGVVMDVLGFVINGLLLGARWRGTTQALGVDVAKGAAAATVGWVVMGFVIGLAIAWTTAAIQPRYAGGAAAGARAGFAAWLIMDSALAAGYNGLYPWSLLLSSIVGGLVTALVAGLVAGAIYKDA